MIKIPKTGRRAGFQKLETSKSTIPKSQTMIGNQIPMTLGPIKASKLHRQPGAFNTGMKTPMPNAMPGEKLADGKIPNVKRSLGAGSKYGYWAKGHVF